MRDAVRCIDFHRLIGALALSWLLLAHSSLAFGDFMTLSPSQPTNASKLQISWAHCNAPERVSYPSPGVIRIDVVVAVCSLDPPGSADLGSLPAGFYTVELWQSGVFPPPPGGSSLISSLSFAVTPASSGQVTPSLNVSDMWWNPSESGWGLSIIQHPSGSLFCVWFTYAPDGSPTWFVIPGGEWATPTRWVGMMYRTSYAPQLADGFDPSRVARTVVGGASLAFNNDNLGVFEYVIDRFSGTKTIWRQPF